MNSRPSTVDAFVLLAIVAASASFLVFRLDNPILWIDEIFTTNYIRNGYDFLLDVGRPDERHPPGHYVLLKAWTVLFGADRVGVRSLSVAWALICLPLVYFIVQLRLDRRTALITAAFLAVFPGFVHYAREARMYAQVFGLLLLASFFFLYLFSRFQTLAQVKRILLTIAFALALAGTFFTHYISGVYYVCFFAAAMAMALFRRDFGWLAYALAGLTLATLIIIPQLLHMLEFVVPSDDEWIPATDLIIFYSMVSGAYDAPMLTKPILYLVYLAGLILLWRNDKDLFLFVGSFLILGPFLLAIIGTVRPVLLVRTLQPFTLLAPLLLALVVTRLPWPRVGVALGLFAVVVNVSTVSRDFPVKRAYLFAEQAAPMLSAVKAPPDAIFYMEHLQPELDLVRIDHTSFVQISFDSMEQDSAAIRAHLNSCVQTRECGRTLVVLEREPLFEREVGARWNAFARSLSPSETVSIEDHIIYVYN